METKLILVANFTKYPGPRYNNQGSHSGEDYYHQVLNGAFYEAVSANEKLIVNLDGVAGYASSFLDEAFGNLVYDYTLSKVKKFLEIVSKEEPDWKVMIESETINEWEERRLALRAPKKTIKHGEWYKINDDEQYIKKIWIQI